MMYLTFINRILVSILLAGATLVFLFVVLSGSVHSSPFNKWYWLSVDTSSIPDAFDVSRWTFWGICSPESYESSSNGDCLDLGPAFPLSPLDNFGNSTALPSSFVTDRDTYYYLSRFSFAFILLSLIFAAISLICSVFQPCWLAMRQVLSFFVVLGLISSITGVSCQTAVTVLARTKFHDANMRAKLGATLLGLSWAGTACFILVFFLSCCSTISNAYKLHKEHTNAQKEMEMGLTMGPTSMQQPSQSNKPGSSGPIPGQSQPSDSELLQQNPGALPSNEGGIRFFKIKRDPKTGDEESI